MNLKWNDLKLFLAVYEQGSLSSAARQLKLGQPTLSRRIAELEMEIGETLFDRQSQGVSLTITGKKLLPTVQSMAEWANQAHFSVSKQSVLPEGKVKIAAPPGIAYEMVAPLAAKIRQRHPHIQIEVLSGVETLSLARGEADLSLRSQKPNDADLMCIDEVSSALRVYTSKTYAKKFKSPPSIIDLDWICWAAPYDELDSNRQLGMLIKNFKPAFTSDDFNVQIAACKAGVGAMILPQGLRHYASMRVMHELEINLGADAVGQLFLVCHKRSHHLPKIQLVIDYISREFELLR